ncbi:MAG: DUF996 domain-containing protein [Candidatus Bathyarchaeota archaeon]|nr:DUF996 domain-containing protein [Candidatus Bathyarchaeota archaeon]
MTLDSSKYLGFIGALLILVGSLVSGFLHPVGGGIVGFVGVIMVLIALYGLGKIYADAGIFKNALLAFIVAIVGAIVTAAVFFAALLANISNIKDFIQLLYPGWDGEWSSLPNLSNMTPNTTIEPADMLPIIGSIVAIIIAVLVVMWIFSIIASFFMRRSLKQVSVKSQVGMFGTAGLLLLIGAFLTIIGIGVILMWIAVVLLMIAFLQLKPTEQTPPPPVYPPPPSQPTPV